MNQRLLAAVAATALIAGAAHASNLVVNGSFETGDFSGWTQGGNLGSTGVVSGTFDGFTAQDGAFFAVLGPVGSDGTLSQSFIDVAGKTYEFSFFLASDGGTPNDFGVTGPNGLSLQRTNVGRSGYVEYIGEFTGTGNDSFTFNFRNDPGYLALDNVSVTAIPEPAAWASMLLGLGLAGGALRRRKAVAAV